MSRPDFIETFMGKRFRPLSPDPELIDIRDIIHALSQKCRFTGHTRGIYSDGQHSVFVSRIVAELGGTREEQLWGLMHDASDFALPDVSTPVKNAPEFAAFREIERRVQNAVCERFGLSYDEPEIVKRADGIALATEARDLMFYRREHWEGLEYEPHPEKIVVWTPEHTRQAFSHRFEELSRWR